MKRIHLFVAMVALVALTVSGTAFAATLYNTKLSISYSRASGGHFSGQITSNHGACIRGRKVTVYRKQGGRDPSIGSSSSSANGTWRLNPRGAVAAGDYYAKTPTINLGSHKGICKGTRSVTTHAS